MMLTTAKKIAGLEFVDTPCPKCQSAMYKKVCPCKMRKQGWNICIKCVKCGETLGFMKKGHPLED